MPPRAPVVWTTTGVRSERFRQRIDERHRELSVQAKARGRAYRRSRAVTGSDEAVRLRADFLAALGRLTMLAMLEEPGEPDLLAYLVHGGPGWPAHRRSAGCGTIPRPGGCSASLAWADLRLDPPTIALKASLIEEYRSQLARGAVLRPFAAENEPFTGGVLVHANRAMSRWRPGVHRASGGVAIDVPRSACGADVAGGGRLRLRYVEAEEIQERLVMLGAVPQVLGGAPGGALVAADDVRVALAPRAVRMRLNGRTAADVRGVVLDAISPGGLRAAAPAWLLRW